MFAELGTVYSWLIIILYLAVALDLISFYTVFVAKKVSAKEFCDYGVRWGKLVLYVIFAIIIIFLGVNINVSFYIKVLHVVVGVLLIADTAYSTYLKKKYGTKKEKKQKSKKNSEKNSKKNSEE